MFNTNAFFCTVCAISTILILLPSPGHIRARNSGTMLLIFWTVLCNICNFVNAIIWSGNAKDVARVWGDFSVAIKTAALVALPASTICISRRLERIGAARTSNETSRTKRNYLIQDMILGIVVPVAFVLLHFVVQGHRYDVLYNIGATPASVSSWLSVTIIGGIPLLFALVSMVYSGLALRWFLLRQKQFQSVMGGQSASEVRSRYIRLMLLTAVDVLTSLPIYVASLVVQAIQPMGQDLSWGWVHADWNRVDVYGREFYDGNVNNRVTLELARFLFPITAIWFFFIFGLTKENIAGYKAIFTNSQLKVKSWGTLLRSSHEPGNISNQRFPSYTGEEQEVSDRKKGEFAMMTDKDTQSTHSSYLKKGVEARQGSVTSV